MIAFTCGIVIGSAFGVCVMGLLWADARDRVLRDALMDADLEGRRGLERPSIVPVA